MWRAMLDLRNRAFGILLLSSVLICREISPTTAQCPSQCLCTVTDNDPNKPKGTKVLCNALKLREVPDSSLLPADTVSLDLSQNKISVLRKGFLAGKENIRRIFLGKNKITRIEDGAFAGLGQLTKLVLSGNSLLNLTGNVFAGCTSLKQLDLSQNRLQFINKSVFTDLKSLRKLMLSNNMLTVFPEKMFSSLKSLTNLQLDTNPVVCDCRFKWLIRWASNADVSLSGLCQFPVSKRGDPINKLRKKDLPTCTKDGHIDLPIFKFEPNGDQLAFKGDNFPLNCQASWSPDAEGLWFFDNKPILENKEGKKLFTVDYERGLLRSTYQIVNLAVQDSGTYECRIVTNGGRVSSRLYLLVVEPHSSVCQSVEVETNKGVFHWHNTVSKGVAQLPCPGKSRYGKRKQLFARRQCGLNGMWRPADLSRCHFINIHTRQLYELRQKSMNSSNSVNKVGYLLEQLTRKAYEFSDVQDIIFVTDIVDTLARNANDSTALSGNLVRTVSNIMNAKADLLKQGQNSSLACKRMIESLEYFTYKILNKKKTRLMNLPSPMLDLEAFMVKPTGFMGQSCTEYVPGKNIFKKGKSLQCSVWINRTNIYPDKDVEATLAVPPSLFSKAGLREVQILDDFVFQVMVFRNSKLFPNLFTSNSKNPHRRKRDVTTSIVSVRLAKSKNRNQNIGGITIANMSEPIVITFKNHKRSEAPVSAYWDFTALDGLGAWVHDEDVCNIVYSTWNVTRVNCYQLMSRNYYAVLGVTDLLNETHMVVPLDNILYIGAALCVLLLLCTLITYIYFRELRCGRDDAAMLMNCCLALMFLSLAFVIGIRRVDHTLLCRSVGVLLHYFALCSLLWFGCGGVCIYRLIKTTIVPVEFNPVLRYYLVSWGVPLIICGITLAGNVGNYSVENYCGLTPYAFLGGFVGPACLFVLIDCVIFIRLHRLIIDVYDKGIVTFGQEEDDESENPDDAVLHTELIEQHSVLQKLPPKEQLQFYLLGSILTMILLCAYCALAVLTIKPVNSLVRIISSYSCGICNVLVGLVIFVFHCVKRSDIRNLWKSSLCCKGALYKVDGRDPPNHLLSDGEVDNKQAGASCEDSALINKPQPQITNDRISERHSDHHSNVSLPSSAALTLDRYGLPLHRTHTKPLQRPLSMIEQIEHHAILDKQSTISAPPEVHLQDPCKRPRYVDRRGPAIIGSHFPMSSSSTLSRINSSRDILNKRSSAGSAVRVPSEKALSDKSSIKTTSDIGHASHTTTSAGPSDASTVNSVIYNGPQLLPAGSLYHPNPVSHTASSYSAQGPVPSVPPEQTLHYSNQGPTAGAHYIYPIPEKMGPTTMIDTPPNRIEEHFIDERPPVIGASSPYPIQQGVPSPYPLQPLAIHPGFAYPGQLNNPRYLLMHPVPYENQGMPPSSHAYHQDHHQMGPPSPKYHDRQQGTPSPIPGYPMGQQPFQGYPPEHAERHQGYPIDRHPGHHQRYYPYAQGYHPQDVQGGYPMKISRSQGSQTPSQGYAGNQRPQNHPQDHHYLPMGHQHSSPGSHQDVPPFHPMDGHLHPHSPGHGRNQGCPSPSYPIEAPSPEQLSLTPSPRISQEVDSPSIYQEEKVNPGHNEMTDCSSRENTLKRQAKDDTNNPDKTERTKSKSDQEKRSKRDLSDLEHEKDKASKMPYVPVPHLRKRQLESHCETSV